MLVVLADTHGGETPQLTDHLRETIADASLVVHAGDFTTTAVLDAFESLAEVVAVVGNSDSAGVRERLPETQVLDRFNRRLLVVHGHRHDRTALSLLARQEAADVVIVGHTHSAGITTVGDVMVVNPGSHASPRGDAPSYAAVNQAEDGIDIQIRSASGRVIDMDRR
jgi:putative phosphoesterase